MAWNQYDPHYAFINPAFLQPQQDASSRESSVGRGVDERYGQPPSERHWQNFHSPAASSYLPAVSDTHHQTGYGQSGYNLQSTIHWPQAQAQALQAVSNPGWRLNAAWPQSAVATQQAFFATAQRPEFQSSIYANNERPRDSGSSNTGVYQPTDIQSYQQSENYQARRTAKFRQRGTEPSYQEASYGNFSQRQTQPASAYQDLHTTSPTSTIQYASSVQALAGYVNPMFGSRNDLVAGHDSDAHDLTNAGENPRLYLLPHPQSTPQYIAGAYARSLAIPIPRKLLIVLDLNGTLLARNRARTTFVGRPDVQKFLSYVLSYHKVVVWSSARPHNVASMVEKLLTQEQRDQLVAIWARDKLQLGAHFNAKVQVYKQLSWLWSDPTIQESFVESEAGFGSKWDQTNTVLIDDSIEKAASEPHNLLQIDEFTREDQDHGVAVLAQVVDYLERLRWQSNASGWMKNNPFYAAPSYANVDWKKLGLDEV